MRLDKVTRLAEFRSRLLNDSALVGTWIQIPSSDFAEIVGDAGYDWAAVDLEHGAVARDQLPDIFRALELGGTLPLSRIALPDPSLCQQSLDAGAAGVILPRIESARQLEDLVAACKWPPHGRRGVGFSRANLYGKYFENYKTEAEQPFVVAQIESSSAVQAISDIAQVPGVDSLMIGPYDLSASLGHTGELTHPAVVQAISDVISACKKYRRASGIHVVEPDGRLLKEAIASGHRFVAYGTDARFFSAVLANPLRK
ncbi:MAG: 2,4-dihydroxyhept-2-ene-1,7-dioic acid aldolase [Actinobacteria bacterium]|nr:2,4-dihydroxyhept-2-ene-1,7-dioic acid aldolase [Actinomycetota bacterium]